MVKMGGDNYKGEKNCWNIQISIAKTSYTKFPGGKNFNEINYKKHHKACTKIRWPTIGK